MRKYYPVLIFIAILLMALPARAEDRIPPDAQVKNADCPVQKVTNPAFEATLYPVRQPPGNEWVAFRLTIQNKSDKPLSLIWDETRYMRKGKESGGFRFENEMFGNKVEPRQPEDIPPGATLSKVIWPASRFYDGGKDMGWFIIPMTTGEGEQGIRLTLKSDGRDLQQALALNIDSQVQVCGIVSNRRG